jgi:hypothetical protein
MNAHEILATITAPDHTITPGKYGTNYGTICAPDGAYLTLTHYEGREYVTSIYPEYGDGTTARSRTDEHDTPAQAAEAVQAFINGRR